MVLLPILFLIAALFIPNGYGLECYSCEPPNPCQTPAKVSCSAPYDRCFTLSNSGMEMRNCSMAAMCTESGKQQMCQGNVNCNFSCCQGDLCNNGTNAPGSGLTPATTASNLSCYECSPEGMGPNGTGTPLISCSAPKQRRCGEIGPGMPFDRCMTIKTTVKNPITGALLEQETKNCSLSSMCSNSMCTNMNDTGAIVKCDIQCCKDNLCNAPPSQTTVGPSSAGPKGGQTPLAVPGILVLISIVMALLFK